VSHDTDQRAGDLLDAVARVQVDRDGCVRSADRVATDLFDVAESELVGMSLAEVAGDQWLGVGGPEVALAALDDAGVWSGYATHHTRAGLLPVALSARRVADRRSDDPAIMLSITVDADRVPSGWVGAVRGDVAVLVGSPRFPALLSLVGWLLTARDSEEIGAAVCGTVIEQMGAVGGHLAVLGEDNTASFVTIVGYSATSRSQWPVVDLTIDTPIRRAIVDVVPVFVPDRAARDEQFPLLRSVDEPTQALCVVPVVLGGRVAGSLGFSFPDARTFPDEDRAFLATAAHVTALALQHTDPVARPHPAAAATGTTIEFTWHDTIDFAAVRDAIRLQALGAQIDPADTLLCASELVTNAAEHGTFPVHARVAVTPEAVRIEVSDAARQLPMLRSPGPDGGFGLRIVEAIASRWGTIPAGWGKMAWVEIAR
jgi:GAF domain-containing protein